jgi:hypothetical protein
MPRKNYYEILGISPDTPQHQIKTAAQAKANEINEAFRVLYNPETRQAYNAQLEQSQQFEPKAASPEPTASQIPEYTAPIFKPVKESTPWLKNSISFIGEYLRIETPTMRDIMIFTVALIFFIYMVIQFLFPSPIQPSSSPAIPLGSFSSRSEQID